MPMLTGLEQAPTRHQDARSIRRVVPLTARGAGGTQGLSEQIWFTALTWAVATEHRAFSQFLTLLFAAPVSSQMNNRPLAALTPLTPVLLSKTVFPTPLPRSSCPYLVSLRGYPQRSPAFPVSYL